MQIEAGMILEGKVTSIAGFGAFIALPEGRTGMVHISEISPSFVRDIRDFLSEGQTVEVMVLNVGENGKIALSIKRAAMKREEEEKAKSALSRAPAEYTPPNRRRTGDGDSFEDMMTRFKAASDEKISDLKKASDGKRSGGYSRRTGRKG